MKHFQFSSAQQINLFWSDIRTQTERQGLSDVEQVCACVLDSQAVEAVSFP